MKSVIRVVVALAVLGLVTAPETTAQEAFFKGKTIRIIVGYPAGGGFDAYSRLIARHAGRHIPGNPTMIVENMPGAGLAKTEEARKMIQVGIHDPVSGEEIEKSIAGLFTLDASLVGQLRELLLQ